MKPKYIELKSFKLVQRSWKAHFKVKTCPHKNTIMRTVSRLEKNRFTSTYSAVQLSGTKAHRSDHKRGRWSDLRKSEFINTENGVCYQIYLLNYKDYWLKAKFGNQFINKLQWPPRSSDLSPYDFFFNAPILILNIKRNLFCIGSIQCFFWIHIYDAL